MEWIKCSDRMPTDKSQGYLVVIKRHLNDTNPRVIGWCSLEDNYQQNESGEWERNGFCWGYDDCCGNGCIVGEDDTSVVTHWMAYPEPPEGE